MASCVLLVGVLAVCAPFAGAHNQSSTGESGRSAANYGRKSHPTSLDEQYFVLDGAQSGQPPLGTAQSQGE